MGRLASETVEEGAALVEVVWEKGKVGHGDHRRRRATDLKVGTGDNGRSGIGAP